jgi:hypothetical protein
MLGMTAAGAAGGMAGNFVSQQLNMALGLQKGGWSWSQFAAAGVGGALGGGAGRLLTRGLPCNASAGQFLLRAGLSGAAGGFLGDAVAQADDIRTGKQDGWSVKRSLFATGLGAATGLANGYGAWRYRNTCFAAGTPLLTPGGSKLIEQFVAGDWVLAAPEHDPLGPVEAKQVEEVFVNTAPLLALRVRDRVIKTTAEHPFWVAGRGWVAARELKEGDRFRSHDGQWVALEGIEDTGEEVAVYNLRVADFHTYFVGSEEWGFSVWAHNTCFLDARSKQLYDTNYEVIFTPKAVDGQPVRPLVPVTRMVRPDKGPLQEIRLSGKDVGLQGEKSSVVDKSVIPSGCGLSVGVLGMAQGQGVRFTTLAGNVSKATNGELRAIRRPLPEDPWHAQIEPVGSSMTVKDFNRLIKEVIKVMEEK